MLNSQLSAQCPEPWKPERTRTKSTLHLSEGFKIIAGNYAAHVGGKGLSWRISHFPRINAKWISTGSRDRPKIELDQRKKKTSFWIREFVPSDLSPPPSPTHTPRACGKLCSGVLEYNRAELLYYRMCSLTTEYVLLLQLYSSTTYNSNSGLTLWELNLLDTESPNK